MQTTTRVLGAAKLKNAYHARGDFMVDDMPNDTMLEEILAPGFWANHWQAIKRGARIEVMRSDNTLDVTLRCLSTAPGLVFVRPIGEPYVDNSNVEQATLENANVDTAAVEALKQRVAGLQRGYKSGYADAGINKGWWVQLKSTREIIANKIMTKTAAVEFAEKHAQMSAGSGQKVA